MTTKEKYNYKRTQIIVSLKTISSLKAERKGIMEVCNTVAKSLGISPQTVYNYTQGRVSDGYLAEAILAELKSYKK